MGLRKRRGNRDFEFYFFSYKCALSRIDWKCRIIFHACQALLGILVIRDDWNQMFKEPFDGTQIGLRHAADRRDICVISHAGSPPLSHSAQINEPGHKIIWSPSRCTSMIYFSKSSIPEKS